MSHELVNLRAQLAAPNVRTLIDHLEYPSDSREIKTNCVLADYQCDVSLQLFGLMDSEALLGLIGLAPLDTQAASIRHIAVHRSRRKQGLGRAMIDLIFSTLNLVRLEAETDDDAIGFYRRCGFAIENLGEQYPGIIRYRCRKDNVSQT